MPALSYSHLTDRQARLVLNALPEIGPVGRQKLLTAAGGDPHAALRFSRVRPDDWARPRGGREAAGPSRPDFLIPDDSAYPRCLREIPDPPVGLYRQGPYAADRVGIALVGTRRATLYGRETAGRFAAELVRLGFCVVSGLARGIDTAAHRGALAAGGPTVAVLGTGLDIIYPPENRELHGQIARQGAVLTEYPFGRQASKQTFPMRNRLVSGMCAAVVVIESAGEGGAMITARLAGEQGRTVFAVPGRIDQPTSAGCHALLRDGATLLTCVDDILSDLSYLAGSLPAPGPSAAIPSKAGVSLTEEERRIMRCFRGGAVLAADDLSALTGLPAGPLSAILLSLELKRLVEKQLDGRYEALRASA